MIIVEILVYYYVTILDDLWLPCTPAVTQKRFTTDDLLAVRGEGENPSKGNPAFGASTRRRRPRLSKNELMSFLLLPFVSFAYDLVIAPPCIICII
jgi:hypothetical protein